LFSAIEKLERYVRVTGDGHTEAYIVDHLKIYASSSHGFLSGDPNLDDVLESISKLSEPDEDDEYDPLTYVHPDDFDMIFELEE
jgi:hypothetical protein